MPMITALSLACPGKYNYASSPQGPAHEKTALPHKKQGGNSFAVFDNNRALVNRAMLNRISFKGYEGDTQPVKKLFWHLTNRDEVYTDNWTNEHLYQVGRKKWVNAPVQELMRRSPEQAIQSICTLTQPYPHIPSNIESPRIGDKWGRRANYIEINPRTVAKFENNRATEGLFGVMKLLPAIPTSPDSFANCIVLSQLYPAMWGEDNSLYGVNLHTSQQISDTLLSEGLYNKMGADEQVRAFNDLAHVLGFKTGFRMPILAGEIQIQGNNFDWNNSGHRKAYVDACVWGLELGFDSIYFDSAKHVLDKDCMTQNLGDPPEDWQMSEVLYYARKNSNRPDASFIGEKCYNNPRYKDIGFTAGTDWGKADNFDSVLWESRNQAWLDDYAAGPEVSNDNYNVDRSTCLNRLNSCLFGYERVDKKLPSFMQLNDIFPLSPFTGTHEMMTHKKAMWSSEGWRDCEKHWNGVFDSDSDAKQHTINVYNIFENVIRARG